MNNSTSLYIIHQAFVLQLYIYIYIYNHTMDLKKYHIIIFFSIEKIFFIEEIKFFIFLKKSIF